MSRCLQEPLQQTVRQVHCAFEALLDILEAQRDHAALLGLPAADAAATSAFLEATARDIVSIGAGALVAIIVCLGFRVWH